MKCDFTDCPNKAKLKMSQDSAWRGVYCFRHAHKTAKALMRSAAANDNKAFFVQKAMDK